MQQYTMNKSTEQTEDHVPWICLPQEDLPSVHSRYTHRSSTLPGGGVISGSSIPVSDHWTLQDPPWGECRQTSLISPLMPVPPQC